MTLAALADPTRRAILARLAAGEASVTELVEPFAMSQPAISKHLKVLEKAGLISRARSAQFRPSRLEAARLKEVADWVDGFRQHWEAKFDRLDAYLQTVRQMPKKGRDMAESESKNSDREIVIERTMNAPRELVWEAWTKAEHIAEWWGPNGFTTTIYEMKVAVGGVWRFIMHGPDGTDYPNKIVYREIVEPERLVYDHGDDEGNDSQTFRSTVAFADQGDKTGVTMRAVFSTKEARDAAAKFGAIDGGNQTLARLEQHLRTMPAR